MSYQHCNGKHDLIPLMTRRGEAPGVEDVVRWCQNCGAVVIDTDVDGRVMRGATMRMAFPRIAQAHVAGVGAAHQISGSKNSSTSPDGVDSVDGGRTE